jgi:hypothetical protein
MNLAGETSDGFDASSALVHVGRLLLYCLSIFYRQHGIVFAVIFVELPDKNLPTTVSRIRPEPEYCCTSHSLCLIES